MAVVVITSCQPDDDVPAFIGTWEFLKASPAENVDSCYQGTWFRISRNNTFSYYNACTDTLKSGTWKQKGIGFEVRVNGKIFDEFQGELVELKSNRMVIETTMFEGKTRVVFVKVDDLIHKAD